jgi:hypothetical protein
MFFLRKNPVKLLLYPCLCFHYIVFKLSKPEVRECINSDIETMNERCNRNDGLLFYLSHHKPYRNLFYYRIGFFAKILQCYIRPYSLFTI